jgi:HAD superfamily hydrolase (TIGR01450 family)
MQSSSNVHLATGLRDIVHHYDVFLIDQWGVMHDGHQAYPDAVACMQQLLALGKHVILLSNSSKRKAGSLVRLAEMGFTPDKYLEIVTSGELTYLGLSPPRTNPPYASIQGTRVLVFGSGDDDRDYVHSMGCSIASVEEADFLLARGPFVMLDSADPSIPPQQFGPGRILHESAEFDALATRAVARGLPMIVSNPDVVRPGGDNDPMPGLIGQAYERKGGKVTYVGKPYPLVYARCRQLMEEVVEREGGREGGAASLKVCAIGDSMWNDIKGAVEEEFASILVTDGIHADALGVEQGSGEAVGEDALDKFWEGFAFKPTHTVPCFRW